MTSGHLVAGLHLTLGCDKDFDLFQNARQQVVTALNFFNLLFKVLLYSVQTRVKRIGKFFDFAHQVFVFDDDFAELIFRNVLQDFLGQYQFLRNALRRVNHRLPQKHFFQTLVVALADDVHFVVAVFGKLGNFALLNRQRAFVFFDAAAVEHLNVNNNAFNARLGTQRRIADVACLFAEDGAQQFFFRRNHALAFRRYLADQNVAGLNLGTDVDNAGFVQVSERVFADVRNIAGDFFLPQLGVTGHNFKFFNMQ